MRPARIANPREPEEDVPMTAPLMLFDPAVSFTVDENSLPCGAQNTPFMGQVLSGEVTLPLR